MVVLPICMRHNAIHISFTFTFMSPQTMESNTKEQIATFRLDGASADQVGNAFDQLQRTNPNVQIVRDSTLNNVNHPRSQVALDVQMTLQNGQTIEGAFQAANVDTAGLAISDIPNPAEDQAEF